MLVVMFMTADPGEAFSDFSYRIEHPRRNEWGMPIGRESRNELIFDRNSAARLVEMLNSYLAQE